MKNCPLCDKDQPETEFAFRSKKEGTRTSHCKACHRLKSKSHYLANRGKYIEKSKKRNKEQTKLTKEYMLSIKSAGCSKCNEKDPCCLDFHHTDPSNKVDAVANLVRGRFSIEKIQHEIDKCVLVCANCHRKLHAGIISIK